MAKEQNIQAFLLGVALTSWASAILAEPLVEIVREGASVGRYETFDDGMKAAQSGDTMKFLRDFVPVGHDSWEITKPLTLDLDGHAATNSLNFNFFIVKDSPVVFENGIIGNTGSAAIHAEGDREVYATNIVFKTCGFSSGSSGAALHAGRGCVFLSALVATWTGARGRVFVEDDSVISTHASLVTNGSSTPNLFVWGGTFAADPSDYVIGLRKAVSRETKTDYGTCKYAVEARGQDEPGVAGVVLGEGLTNVCDSVDGALKRDRAGDTVALLADAECAAQGTGFTIGRRLTLDLNGHTISNRYGNSVLTLTADGVVIRNGTLAGHWNALLNFDAANVTAIASNVVFRRDDASTPNTAVVNAVKVGTKAVLNGCVVEPALFLLSPAAINDKTPCTASIDVEGSDVYSTRFVAGAETSVQSVLSGRFVADPTAYLASGVYVTPISETTDRGTLLYRAFPISTDAPLALDLSASEPLVVRGTLPESVTTIPVVFTNSGDWKGRRKLVADFSELTNGSGLSISVVSYPESFGSHFETSLVDGKLYARVRRGMAVIIR